MLTNPIHSAFNGLYTFENKLYESAQNISKFPATENYLNNANNIEQTKKITTECKEILANHFSQISSKDITSNVVNMITAENGYKANLNVLKTSKDMSKA
jgi:flagellar basal body rod protein FlgC